MNSKCFIFTFVVIMEVFEAKSECKDYFNCFNEFIRDFFVNDSQTITENINIPPGNLPENFVEIKDVKFSEFDSALADISELLQGGVSKQINIEPKADMFKQVSSKTKIYIKTFNINDSTEANFENPDFNRDVNDMASLQIKESPTGRFENDNIHGSRENKDVRENVIINTDFVDTSEYDFNEDNSTDYPIIDYIEVYKDTTNEEYIYIPTDIPSTTVIAQQKEVKYKENIIYPLDTVSNELRYNTPMNLGCHGNMTNTIDDVIFPWIVTIFVKNQTSDDQFGYFCDGALLWDKSVLTAARCVHFLNNTVYAEDLLIVLGKRSLQSMGEDEKAFKIKNIVIHENFTSNDDKTENDLAILILEETVIFSGDVQSSCLGNGEFDDVEESATTAWRVTGELTPVYFEKRKNELCGSENKDNTICATYGNDVALCPSYGGVYVTRLSNKQWYLQGIRFGDPAERGICYNKKVSYTSLKHYIGWITENVNDFKYND